MNMLTLLLVFFLSSMEIQQSETRGEGMGGLGDLGGKILERVTIHRKPATFLVLLHCVLSYLGLPIRKVDGGSLVFLDKEIS